MHTISVVNLEENSFLVQRQKTIAVSGTSIKMVLERSLLGCTRLCSTDVNCRYGSFSTQNGECKLDFGRNPLIQSSSSHMVFMKCVRQGIYC